MNALDSARDFLFGVLAGHPAEDRAAQAVALLHRAARSRELERIGPDDFAGLLPPAPAAPALYEYESADTLSELVRVLEHEGYSGTGWSVRYVPAGRYLELVSPAGAYWRRPWRAARHLGI
jgi:hypothetical protein